MKKQGSVNGKGRKAGASGKVTVTIGRQRFEKISSVEGISLSGAMKKRAADFDRVGSSAEERRTTIIRSYRKG